MEREKKNFFGPFVVCTYYQQFSASIHQLNTKKKKKDSG